VNYYNEIDPKSAAWLRELIKQGHIPSGDVDERSIVDVQPNDLVSYTQCHFFAGIGGWPLALHIAGWPADRSAWTGSCPCQSFSCAGKQKGVEDPRHLWPAFFRLIRECRPDTVFGEQVEAAIGHGWLDGICADLEGEGYAVGQAVLGAHSVGAPHIRQRLYWVAQSDIWGCAEGRGRQPETAQSEIGNGEPEQRGRACWMADSAGRGQRIDGGAPGGCGHADQCGAVGWLADGEQSRLEGHTRDVNDRHQPGRLTTDETGPTAESGEPGRLGNAEGNDEQRERQSGESDRRDGQAGRSGAWGNYDIIPCRDGKARRVESGTFPLVDGLPRGVVPSCDPGAPGYAQATAEARVMRLKGYGNSIVPQLAAEFITAYLDSIQ